MVERRTPSDLNDYLVLEVDGPGVSPETVDPVILLELAASFFRLVEANAEEDLAESFSLRDLYVLDKCVCFASRPTSLAEGKLFANAAAMQIAGSEPPRGGADAAARARRIVGRLPFDQHVKVMAGGWERMIELPGSVEEPPMAERTSFRATPYRVGGKTRPTARFKARAHQDFTLHGREDLLRALARQLYLEVEIVARIRRGNDGEIETGELLSFEAVEDVDPRTAWREWFRSVGGDLWDHVADIEAELAR
jgi:hypothetical protein